LRLTRYQKKPFVLKIVDYLKRKAASNLSLSTLSELLSQSALLPIGLILTERLINVPAEVTPPMYTMLLEEIQWALEEKEPYTFSHYLILSKTYTEIASKLDVEDDRPKKKKKKKATACSETFYFHPEDEIFHKHAICRGGYDYNTRQDEGHSDSKRAFQEMGIKPQGHMILIEAPKFAAAVQEVAGYFKPS
jgi:protein BCP1